MSFFGVEISGLTPPVLFELAEQIDSFSEKLRQTANENEARLNNQRNYGHHQRSVRAATKHFSKLVENGADTETALDEAAAQYCVPRDSVSVYVSLYKVKQKKLEKALRDRQIMKLWRAGHPLNHVARKTGVTVRTVNRVIREFREI